MATKAEIIKDLADLGVTASMKSSKADLQTLLEDAKVAAQDAEDTAAESPPEDTPEFKIKMPGQILLIRLVECGDEQICEVTRYYQDAVTVDQVFTAQSYDDVLVSLENWLQSERRRWA